MSFTKSIYKVKSALSDKSPAILVAFGIVTFVGTVVLACKETKKATDILEDHVKEAGDIRELLKKKEENDPEFDDVEYTKNDARKEKVSLYLRTSYKIVRNYAPAIICGSVSITCFLYSYKILNRRYLAASALAASLYETLSSYRKRVAEKYGEDEERALYFGTHEAEVTEIDGKGKEVTKNVDILDENNLPIYAKFFDEASNLWKKDASLNLMTLKYEEQRANRKFKDRGYLLLNEVYADLDIPLTDIGNEVGWFEGRGDQFVSFGIFNGSEERKRAFINGYEPSVLLNFNCIPKKKGDLAYA